MRIIPFYLPQFHQIPENDEWWGKGFTEWTNVRAAKPLFKGHAQPRVPFGANYYDLTSIEVLDWQANLAKKYGIYGFCFYHYWFDGHLLLEKPIELLLKHPEIDMRYCICWANENWTNAWKSGEPRRVLIEQTYGDYEMWEQHFDYLLEFFKDQRYIKIDGKPLIVIYRPEIISELEGMLSCWRNRAIESGLDGLTIAFQHVNFNGDSRKSLFDKQIEYQPMYVRSQSRKDESLGYLWSIKKKFDILTERTLHRTFTLSKFRMKNSPECFSYDEMWERILSMQPCSSLSIPGAFVDWDNTSRLGNRGSVAIGSTPEKFEEYFRRLLVKARTDYHSDYIFLFAWNEWAECGYLEPDELNKFGYLEAIRSALIATDELSYD